MGRSKKGSHKKKGGVITKAPRTEAIQPDGIDKIEAAGANFPPTNATEEPDTNTTGSTLPQAGAPVDKLPTNGISPPPGQEIVAIQPTGTTLPPNDFALLGLGSMVRTLVWQ